VSEAPDTEPAEYRRFYLNQIVAPEESVVDLVAWAGLANADSMLTEGDTIALGFDGSDVGDATCLYACRWPDWTLFPLGIWERPEGSKDWKVDRAEVSAVVADACKRFKVVRGYFDDSGWQSEIDGWAAEFGQSVMRFPHRSDARIGAATERFSTMVAERTLRHTGHPALTRHMANARRAFIGRQTDGKAAWWRPARRHRDRPIDAFSAALGAVHALGDAVAHGETTAKAPSVFFYVPSD
jgi:phage terminase large subunit-like protein